MAFPGGADLDGWCCNADGCSCGPLFWANAEFLLWWTKSAPLNPPLLTQATILPTNDSSGAIGSPGTAVLLGGQSYGLGQGYGGRFTVGSWFDPCSKVGAEASYLFIAPNSTTKQFGTNGDPGSPNIGIPYFGGLVQTERFLPLGGPDLNVAGGPAAGGAFMTITNSLQSAELNGLGQLYCCGGLQVCGLAGVRYIYFKEQLDYGAGFQALPSAPFGSVDIRFQRSGGAFASIDQFQGVNNFYGGQVGLRAQYQCGNLFINTTGKVALGDVYQTSNIDGGAVYITPTLFRNGHPLFPGTTTAYPTGIFAQGTNSGHASRQEFAVAPEWNLNVGYNITKNVRAYVGYTILYLNNVVRPGQQIDHSINFTQPNVLAPSSTLTGSPVPAFPFNHTDFWAQGINIGLAVGF